MPFIGDLTVSISQFRDPCLSVSPRHVETEWSHDYSQWGRSQVLEQLFFLKEGSGISFKGRHSFFWNGHVQPCWNQAAGPERLSLPESSDPVTKDFCVCSVGRTQPPDLSCCFHLVKPSASICTGLRSRSSELGLCRESFRIDGNSLEILTFGFSNDQGPCIRSWGPLTFALVWSCVGHCTTLSFSEVP